MRKIVTTLLLISIFVLFMPAMPTGAEAAPLSVGTNAADPTGGCPAGTYRVRRHTKRGRKLVNAAIAGGIGAAIGGGVGGGRGALFGLGAGSGGYLLYRYVKDSHGRCVRSYVRG